MHILGVAGATRAWEPLKPTWVTSGALVGLWPWCGRAVATAGSQGFNQQVDALSLFALCLSKKSANNKISLGAHFKYLFQAISLLQAYDFYRDYFLSKLKCLKVIDGCLSSSCYLSPSTLPNLKILKIHIKYIHTVSIFHFHIWEPGRYFLICGISSVDWLLPVLLVRTELFKPKYSYPNSSKNDKATEVYDEASKLMWMQVQEWFRCSTGLSRV